MIIFLKLWRTDPKPDLTFRAYLSTLLRAISYGWKSMAVVMTQELALVVMFPLSGTALILSGPVVGFHE